MSVKALNPQRFLIRTRCPAGEGGAECNYVEQIPLPEPAKILVNLLE